MLVTDDELRRWILRIALFLTPFDQDDQEKQQVLPQTSGIL